MIAPDGKKSKLAVEDLKKLIDRLPEVPAEEKELMERMDAMRKQTQGKKNTQTDTAAFNAGRRAALGTSQKGDLGQPSQDK